MNESINPPVRRIFFVGPKADALKHAAALYNVCRERRQIPAFYENRTLAGVIRRLRCPTTRTGIITFGPGSEGVYEQTCREFPGIKVLRLLEPDAPPPKFFFSYQNQIFPYPETAEDYGIIASWMGLHRKFTDKDIFTVELPHSIPIALLEQEEPK